MQLPKRHILVVDDDAAHRAMLKTLLESWAYGTTDVDDGEAAVDLVQTRAFDLILMDVRMLKMSGLAALQQIKKINPAIPIVIMTAYSSVETAVEALKNGAFDYLTKPLDFDNLHRTIARATDFHQTRQDTTADSDRLSQPVLKHRIIGDSPAVKTLLKTIVQVANSDATVLVTGESGTGKELIAEAIHANSARQKGPLVKINCAAVTETLLESELFGHEKGAFTGAERLKKGRFEQADGGTFFLDEISEMSLTMQVKLLRVLQERELSRVGGEAVIPIDVRLIAATNRNLPDLIKAAKFRNDLFYRLNVIDIQVPALRDRITDIPLLAHHFLDHFARQNKKKLKGFTPQAIDRLIRHGWPGNVRELRNAIERGVVLSESRFLDRGDFQLGDPNGSPNKTPGPGQTDTPYAGQSLQDLEREAIIQTLAATQGNKSEAARRLGITRKTLHQKLKKFGLMST